MTPADGAGYDDTRAVLATMHGKQRVIAPVLERGLGLRVVLAQGIDTDHFGTFSREVARTGSQLDAARAKIGAAFSLDARARYGVASEGSFGPHPFAPFIPSALEIVMLIDRATGLELSGRDSATGTNFGHRVVASVDDATAFAERAGFPAHGLIVIGCVDGEPVPARALIKDIRDSAQLEVAVRSTLALCGSAFVEIDMRAHRNPTRMAAIGRAARDLVRRFDARCPHCQRRGFDVSEHVAGLPCEECGAPTRAILHHLLTCSGCGYRERRPAGERAGADPGRCDFCNP